MDTFKEVTIEMQAALANDRAQQEHDQKQIDWIRNMSPFQLLAQYDMFNSEREKLVRSGGNTDNLTKQINRMSDRIIYLMST